MGAAKQAPPFQPSSCTTPAWRGGVLPVPFAHCPYTGGTVSQVFATHWNKTRRKENTKALAARDWCCGVLVSSFRQRRASHPCSSGRHGGPSHLQYSIVWVRRFHTVIETITTDPQESTYIDCCPVQLMSSVQIDGKPHWLCCHHRSSNPPAHTLRPISRLWLNRCCGPRATAPACSSSQHHVLLGEFPLYPCWCRVVRAACQPRRTPVRNAGGIKIFSTMRLASSASCNLTNDAQHAPE